MATIKRVFIFLTCLTSGLAAVLTLVALVTERWVGTNNARWTTNLDKPNTVEYGLFQGSYTQQQPLSLTVQITMTCLLSENVCALLCGKTDDDRYELLRQLYNNDPDASYDNSNCPSVQRADVGGFVNRNITQYSGEVADDKIFINAGVWVSTIFFLSLSIAAGVACSALSIWNTVSNPVEAYFSILGLYIYNAIAMLCVVIAMCLWGIMHLSTTFHNVGIFYTLVGQMSSDKTVYLGYSFWILIAPIVLYFATIVLLYLRQYLLSRDPGHKMVQREDTADPGIYLY